MAAVARLLAFARKPLPQKWAALRATFLQPDAASQRRIHGLLTGKHAPPRVLQDAERMYIAYRPDSDVTFRHHPEMSVLSERWVQGNAKNNAGDLPRLYALVLNVKQLMADGIPGDIAELGVYRGNSAATLAHFARLHGKQLYLFDTFEGFDRRDLVGGDERQSMEFADTSLDQVRALVGDESVTFVRGRFPQSIPPGLPQARFSIVHIDCDLYEPAKAGLEFFYPRLSPGGLIILHDYANPHWPGIKRAVDDYCRTIPERPIILGDKSGTAMIRKAAACQSRA